MAGENVPSEGVIAASPAPESAPVAVIEPVAAPLPAETAVVAPEAPPAAASAVEAVPVEPAATELKPAEGPAVEPAVAEAAPAEPVATPEPVEAVLPTYEPFKFPEGITAAPEQVTAAMAVFGKYGLTQEAGQELIDLHSATIKSAQEAMDQRQRDVFAETRAGWVKELDKKFGNRRDTVVNDAKWAITELVKNKDDQRALYDALAYTGAGDHPAIINAFSQVAKRLRERNAPPQGLAPKGQPARAADRRYGAPPGR